MRFWVLAILGGALISAVPARAQGTGPGTRAANPSSSALGDIANGRSIIKEKGGCLTCHRLGGEGSRLGPNLKDFASQRTVEQLRAALISPNPTGNSQYRMYKVITRTGKVIQGKLLNQDMYTLQMMDAKENLVAISRATVKSEGFVDPPAMPSFNGTLSNSEMADVVAYLASLKGSSLAPAPQPTAAGAHE